MSLIQQARKVVDATTRQFRRLERKRVAYSKTFMGANGKPHMHAQTVLNDLRRVAGIDKGGIVVSPISRMVDPHATAYRAGQRDMYLRVVKMLGLDGAVTEDDNDD